MAAEHRELISALREGPEEAEMAARYHVVRGMAEPPGGWVGR